MCVQHDILLLYSVSTVPDPGGAAATPIPPKMPPKFNCYSEGLTIPPPKHRLWVQPC